MATKKIDFRRVVNERRQGEVGIYIDPYSAVPLDPQQHGSEHCFMMELGDKLYDELQKVQLDVIKGGLERKGICDGVIIEKLHKGNIFSCSFESEAALENLWQAYEDDLIGPVMHEVLSTPELAKAVGATDLVIRTRIYEDEIDDCRKDFRNNIKAKVDFDCDRKMIHKVRDYQKSFAQTIMTLRDDFSNFEATLGDFTLIIKRNIPSKIQQICTFTEFENVLKTIKEKKNIRTKSFENYFKVREELKRILREIDAMVCHRLAQIHRKHETANQNELRKQMKERRQLAEERLNVDYNFAKLRHIEWASKIVLREHKLFLGLVSVVALAVDTVIDIDQMIDEYVSGFTEYKV